MTIFWGKPFFEVVSSTIKYSWNYISSSFCSNYSFLKVLCHTKSIPQTGRAACEQFPYKSYGGESGRPKQQPPPSPTLARPPDEPYAYVSVIFGFNWFLWPSRMEPPAYIAYHGPFCIPMAAHQTCYPVCPQAEPRWGSPCILLYKVWKVAGPVAQTLISRVGELGDFEGI